VRKFYRKRYGHGHKLKPVNRRGERDIRSRRHHHGSHRGTNRANVRVRRARIQVRAIVELRPQKDNRQEQSQYAYISDVHRHGPSKTELRPEWLRGQAAKPLCMRVRQPWHSSVGTRQMAPGFPQFHSFRRWISNFSQFGVVHARGALLPSRLARPRHAPQRVKPVRSFRKQGLIIG
jgi:hypothetical protein